MKLGVSNGNIIIKIKLLMIEIPIGMANITLMKVFLSASVSCANTEPPANETMMPKVMLIWVRVPAGPLTSIGDTSEMYFGQNTEKAPAAAPYRNLPMTRQGKFGMMVNTDATITRKLVK